MALVAADKLVVPVNADDFSVAALENMFFSVYGLYSFGGTMAQYEKGMFHSILKEQGLSAPKIHAVVHNRSTIFKDARGDGFRAMNTAQAQTLYSAYKKAEEKGELDRIFNKEQLERSELTKINKADEFAEVFTGTMRDMLTSAIATQHLGIPLWFVHRSRKLIKKDLNISSVKHSASSSLKDLIGAEKSKDRSLMQLFQGSSIPRDKCADVWTKFKEHRHQWNDVEDLPAGSPSTAHASKKRKGE